MAKLHVYLNFAGNTEEAFNFYREAFGGEFKSLIRFKDMPMEGVILPKDAEDKIMHIGLPIGRDDLLMATDALESMGQELVPGNNANLFIQTDSKEEADRLFGRLSAGGTVGMPMMDQPWGDYMGSFEDKFGILWMLAYTYPIAT
jgi:PhnB protein